MNILESLENLKVSESCFNDILREIENILNEEATTSEWKKAAQDSIKSREKALSDYKRVHDTFKSGFDQDTQKKINDRHQKGLNRLSDRLERAKYLSSNLPNSNRHGSANVLKRAAKKSVPSRSVEVDKHRVSELNNLKDGMKRGNERLDNHYVEKAEQDRANLNKALAREDHARVLADKTIRTATGAHMLRETPGAVKYVKK